MRWRWQVTAALVVAVVAASTPTAAQDAQPVPQFEIEPGTELVDGQQVVATGSGFDGAEFVSLVECVGAAADFEDCDFSTQIGVEVATDGTFTTAYPVSAIIETPASGEVDCRTDNGCLLVAQRFEGGTADNSARVALAFDPDAPLAPPPGATIEPRDDLVDGQVVTVTGSGFRPGRGVELLECAPEPASFADCTFLNSSPFIDEQGAFTTSVSLFAIFTTAAGEIDCRAVAEPCVVVASQGAFSAPRSARVTVTFDPDAPLLPPPTIEITPSAALDDGATVTVRGTGFTPDSSASISVCQAGDVEERCDDQSFAYVVADSAGAIEASLSVFAEFDRFDLGIVDCRATPGCEVVVRDYARSRTARAPITFGPAPPPRGRFLDPVFDEVEVTSDVVYREAVDYQGNNVELHLDIYEPKGDAAERRPLVIWMHGGYFIFGDKSSMAGYASQFARRGYVAVSLQYRLRSGIPTSDIPGIVAGAYDAYDDATAAVAWLRDHAREYRIDTDAIASGGYSAGAVTALNLAYLPGEFGSATTSSIDAAVSIAGVSFGTAQAGDPPSIVFHGTADTTVPYGAGETSCLNTQAQGVLCELVRYEGGTHGIVSNFERDIVRRTADFLAFHLLDLGAPPPGTSPEPPPNEAVPSPEIRPATPAPIVVAAPRFTG